MRDQKQTHDFDILRQEFSLKTIKLYSGDILSEKYEKLCVYCNKDFSNLEFKTCRNFNCNYSYHEDCFLRAFKNQGIHIKFRYFIVKLPKKIIFSYNKYKFLL